MIASSASPFLESYLKFRQAGGCGEFASVRNEWTLQVAPSEAGMVFGISARAYPRWPKWDLGRLCCASQLKGSRRAWIENCLGQPGESYACFTYSGDRDLQGEPKGSCGRAASSATGGERIRTVRQLQTLPLANLRSSLPRPAPDIQDEFAKDVLESIDELAESIRMSEPSTSSYGRCRRRPTFIPPERISRCER
jgi:hypothetical protein